MAVELHGKGHPILQIDLKKWLDNCRYNCREGTLVCSAMIRGGAVDGPASPIAGNRPQVVRYELVLIEMAEVLSLGR